jgi:hypothetical protein
MQQSAQPPRPIRKGGGAAIRLEPCSRTACPMCLPPHAAVFIFGVVPILLAEDGAVGNIGGLFTKKAMLHVRDKIPPASPEEAAQVPGGAEPPAPGDAAPLAAALRAELSGASPPDGTDWPLLYRLARRHCLAAYLYPFARRHGGAAAADLLSSWRRAALDEAQRAALAGRQLGRILEAFHSAGIPCIPVKGAWIAEKLYGPEAARSMSDFDLMIRLEDARRAIALLEADGFVLRHPVDPGNPRIQSAGFRPSKGRPFPVELVWAYDVYDFDIGRPLPTAPMERLWEGARIETLAGVDCLALAPEDHLVFLANHLLHHAFVVPIRAYLDIALLLRRLADGFDAQRLAATARAWRMERTTALAAHLAGDLLGAPAGKVLDEGLPGIDCPPEQRRAAAAIALEVRLDGNPVAASRLLSLKERGFWGRLGLMLERIWADADTLRARYPWAKGPLRRAWARAIRTRDLARDHGRNVARALDNRANEGFLDASRRRQELAAWVLGEN